MESLTIKIEKALPFLEKDILSNYASSALDCKKILEDKSGKGNDFLGWLNLPSSITEEELKDIQETAESLRKKSEFIVVIGIGGSYLGAKAIIEALSFHLFPELSTKILFAGHHLSEDYLYELAQFLNDKSFSIIVISKSGTTTEPAVAFRILKNLLENKEGISEAQKRIIAITDKSKGALRTLANQQGYKTFPIEDDIGGRFSVLSPVGLLPVAAAGFNIIKLIEGARNIETESKDNNIDSNIVLKYAVLRYALYKNGKAIEILANYHPKLIYLSEWWKQLFGESEGKESKGIFPASVSFTTDLHSMGQFIQDGPRHLFETVLSVENTKYHQIIPEDKLNLDKLNYIAGKKVNDVNKMAMLGTQLAHVDGSVPNLEISIPELSEYYLGQLIYFFEKACAISGCLLDVNPFDQPGVEAYKKNMFALLGKQGFENETKEIRKRISD